MPKPAWIDPVCSSAIDVSRVYFFPRVSSTVDEWSSGLWFVLEFQVFFFFQSILSTVFYGILVMALKFDGLVEPYTGREGTEDWDDFLQKFLVLADISGWNSSKRMARLPLFLKGDAFKVFRSCPRV